MSEKIQAMRTISQWLEGYNWKIYYNQKNHEGYPIFHATSNSKPDLLATKNQYKILIEVKYGKNHKDILDGVDQLISYAGQYYTGRVQYRTTHTININGFLLATNYSKFGYLYSLEANLPCLDYTELVQLYDMRERPITHTVTRLLWRSWSKGLAAEYYENLRRGSPPKTTNPPRKPRIGIIVAKTSASSNQILEMPYMYLNSNQFSPMGGNTVYAFEDSA